MDDSQIRVDSKVILDRWWESMKTLLSTPMPKETDFEMLLNETKAEIPLESRIRTQQKVMTWLMTQMSLEIANINAQLLKLQNNQK
jgi:hypothetical protein